MDFNVDIIMPAEENDDTYDAGATDAEIQLQLRDLEEYSEVPPEHVFDDIEDPVQADNDYASVETVCAAVHALVVDPDAEVSVLKLLEDKIRAGLAPESLADKAYSAISIVVAYAMKQAWELMKTRYQSRRTGPAANEQRQEEQFFDAVDSVVTEDDLLQETVLRTNEALSQNLQHLLLQNPEIVSLKIEIDELKKVSTRQGEELVDLKKIIKRLEEEMNKVRGTDEKEQEAKAR